MSAVLSLIMLAPCHATILPHLQLENARHGLDLDKLETLLDAGAQGDDPRLLLAMQELEKQVQANAQDARPYM